MANSRQPNPEPPRKSVITVLAAIVLVLGVVLVLVLRPSSSRRSKTEPATDESAQPVTPAALAKIGGPEAVALSADTLRSTINPREITTLARNLEQLAPGEYRTASVDAARAALAEALSGKLPGADVAGLFTVLQQYAGSDALQDFQNASGRWTYYSAIALGGLADGAGIPALTQMAQPDSANRNTRSAALQVLAQMSPDSLGARAAFLEQAKTDLPAATWIKIGSLLSGEQFQLGSRADSDVPEAAV